MLNEKKLIEQYGDIQEKSQKISFLLGYWMQEFGKATTPDLSMVNRYMRDELTDPKQVKLARETVDWILMHDSIIDFISIAEDYVRQLDELLSGCLDT